MTITSADRCEIADLIARYAAAVDSRDWPAVADLFTEDGVLVSPDPPAALTPVHEQRGHAEIVATMRRLEAFALTFHHVTGVVVDSSDGAVTARATAVAHHVEAANPPRSYVWHVVYDDVVVKTARGWRFSRRALTIRMIESRPVARIEP